MSKDLKDIASWLSANRLTLNALKTDFMVVGSRQRVASLEEDIALSLLDTELEKVKSVKCLGVDIDEYLTRDNHMLSIRQKVTRNLSVLRRVKPFLKRENLPERILRSPKVAQIFTETVLHLPEQKSGMIWQTV